MTKVIVLKLLSGEELIGKVDEIPGAGDRIISITEPLAIQLQRQQNGDVGVGLLPFMPYMDVKTVTFKSEHVMCVSEVDEKFKNQYNSIFGGIVTPPKKLLLA